MKTEISDIDHPLLEPYREMRSRNWTQQSGIFVAEGPLLVEQMLSSSYSVKSILLDRKYQQHYESLVPDEVELLLVEHEFVAQIVGYNFHRGILACGRRKPIKWVHSDLSRPQASGETLLAVVGVQDPENLGGILRSCAAFGIRRVILGPGTADPLARRVLRVSMGCALHLDLYRTHDLLGELPRLHDELGIESVATTLQDDSQPLESAVRSGPILILVGNERYGLPPELQALASRRVRIGMELGTDSLNVGVAAGVVMHYFSRIQA